MILTKIISGLARSQFFPGSIQPRLVKLVQIVDSYRNFENVPVFNPALRRPLVGLILAMAPAVLAASGDEQDEESTDDEDRLPIVAPKGKYLWCQDDSYGYTKGTDCLS